MYKMFTNIENNINLKLKKPKIISIDQELGSNINSFNKESDSGVYNFKFGFDSNPEGLIIDEKEKEGFSFFDIGSYNDENFILKWQVFNFNNDNPTADCDAHSLPFKDNSIDVLINLAVMEHIEFPHIAGREFRVLKPGGLLLTNVAFLQQHHMSSLVSFYSLWCI